MTLSLAAAPGADAGPPGKWTVISAGGGSNILEAGTYRTGDGTLHVAIARDNPDNSESIDVVHVSETGKLLGRTTVVDHWPALSGDPDLVGDPGGGMRLVFGGQGPGVFGTPGTEGYLYQQTSDPSGTVWSPPSPAVTSSHGYASYGSGAATLADGTLVAAFPLNTTIYFQVGAGALQTFEVADCCAYDMALASDGTNVWAAWYANGDQPSQRGTFVRQIHPALGPIVQAPGSSTNSGSLGTSQGVAIAARNQGGIYVAYLVGYPTAKTLAVWKVGASTYRKVPGSRAADGVAMSAAPTGRLWLAFDDDSNKLHAVRTGTNGQSFGKVRAVKSPKGNPTIFGLFIEGTRARADLVVNDGVRFWHEQLIPGMSLKAKPKKWTHGQAMKVKFTVRDADEALKGTHLKAKWLGNKLTCTTNGKGVCKLSFPKTPKTKIKVTAKKKGYAPDALKLKVT